MLYYSQQKKSSITGKETTMNNKKAWYVIRPTYAGGFLERPATWRIEEVEEGTARDRMLASGRTENSAGELVELPWQAIRFEDQASAEAWMTEEAERWERWYAFWNS
jgi:hypothetical protein